MSQLVLVLLAVMATGVLLVSGWRRGVSKLVRSRVEDIESDVVFDPVLGFCAEGEPFLLHDPAFDTTVFFFDGFRIRPAAAMHRPWLERLHAEHRVNVVAPVLGRQSMSFKMRNRDWGHQEECRAALQLIDAYRCGRGPDHRIVVVGFSWGAVNAYTLAALGRSDATVLVAPLPHRLEAQIDKAIRNRGPAGRLLRWAVHQMFAGRGFAVINRILPYYLRPGVSGGWDIADPGLRARYNREILNGQELRIYDVYEIIAAADHARREVVPRIMGTDVTVVWGEKDSMFASEVFEDLARTLLSQGNEVQMVPLPSSAHNVFHDADASTAYEALAAAVSRQRARVGSLAR